MEMTNAKSQLDDRLEQIAFDEAFNPWAVDQMQSDSLAWCNIIVGLINDHHDVDLTDELAQINMDIDTRV